MTKIESISIENYGMVQNLKSTKLIIPKIGKKRAKIHQFL